MLLLALPGCGFMAPKKETARRFEKQHQAGSVHLSVLSVARWEDYVDALQPAFQLSESDALALVVPATRAMEQSSVDAMVARLSGSVVDDASRKSTTTTTATDEQVPGGSRTTQQQTTEQDLGPDVPGRERPLVVRQGEVPGLYRDPSLEVLPDMDPLLRYWSATALYQEVQLLNRYVRDAALRDGFVPYVVRLQVSLMPTARNEPYDAYCTVSFFSKDVPEETPSPAGGASWPAGSARTLLRGGPEMSRSRTPHIVPLMVTDNLEATLHSKTEDRIRQMAGSFFLLSGKLGASADLERLNTDFQRVFGKDLNSLLTVGRVTDNTLRVRLGAMQQTGTSYAMVPRTHSISVLVMVPRGSPPSLDVVARTVMVDSESGVALPDRSPLELDVQIAEVIGKYGIQGLERGDVDDLLAAAQRNDQYGYFRSLEHALGKENPGLAYARSLWVDLALLLVGSQYAATEFDLPSPGGVSAGEAGFFPRQTVLLLDDGVATRGILRASNLASTADLSATLIVRQGGREVPLLFQDARLELGTGDLELVFPSLGAWGLEQSTHRLGDLRLLVEIAGTVGSCEAIYQKGSWPEPRDEQGSPQAGR